MMSFPSSDLSPRFVWIPLGGGLKLWRGSSSENLAVVMATLCQYRHHNVMVSLEELLQSLRPPLEGILTALGKRGLVFDRG